jgi:hypothetical protein
LLSRSTTELLSQADLGLSAAGSVRYPAQFGEHKLTVSFTGHDPKRTSPAASFADYDPIDGFDGQWRTGQLGNRNNPGLASVWIDAITWHQWTAE